MDIVVTTSLEALLQRATNPQNENVDKAAVEAFCALINKETEGCHIGVKVLANKIHVENEKEALQTLGVLDTCMQKCGVNFQSEVGKFRFLNEMIKLVSPKYLGSQTPVSVRVKVLQLLQAWTEDFPKETKIKEAYEMLRKQGVIVEFSQVQKSCELPAAKPQKTSNSIFDNDERSRLLQKLLQSKNPDDLHAANRLIKTMVKEDDKRAELVSKRTIELEAVHNNVRLLNEMLDSYRPGCSSADELDLIKELHQSCERLRPNVIRLAAETQQNEEMLKEVLQANDELGQVFDKYIGTITKGVVLSRQTSDTDSLLDLGDHDHQASSLLDAIALPTLDRHLGLSAAAADSDMDALCDIFSSVASQIPVVDSNILKPTALSSGGQAPAERKMDAESAAEERNTGKMKALEELDVLGESMLKEGLLTKGTSSFNNKPAEKIPMNRLAAKQQRPSPPPAPAPQQAPESAENNSGDDTMVDITEDAALCLTEVKPLTDVADIPLETIKPSNTPPVTVLDDADGLNITLHFAKESPRPDVRVIVVTTTSRSSRPLSEYLFQAVVPKSCKIRMQKPSGCELPPFNPFLPPSALTQVVLVASPAAAHVSLKFMVSYCMDGETCTEMGQVEALPPVLV